MRLLTLRRILAAAILTVTGFVASPAEAQNTVGGHIGVLFPIFTHANDETTDISDDFTIGFPVGITVRKSPAFAFDLEFVPVIQNEPLDVMNLGLADIGGGSSIFAEAVMPVRFQEDSFGDGFTSIGFGIHLGVGF